MDRESSIEAQVAAKCLTELAVSKLIEATSPAYCALIDWCLSKVETDMGKHVAGIPEEKLEPTPKVEAKPVPVEQIRTDHFCTEHNVPFFKKGAMKGFAHPIEGRPGQWHNEGK